MKHEMLRTLRTRIDDLSPIETVLSEEALASIFGGAGSAQRVTFKGITVKGGCGTSIDHDAKECDE